MFRKVDPVTARETRAYHMARQSENERRPLNRFADYETRHIFDEMERLGLNTPKARAIAINQVKEALAKDAVVERLRLERKRLDMVDLTDELKVKFDMLENAALSVEDRKEVLSWAID